MPICFGQFYTKRSSQICILEVVKEKGPDPADSSASEFVTSPAPRCRAVYEMPNMNSSCEPGCQGAPPYYHSPGSTPRSFEVMNKAVLRFFGAKFDFHVGPQVLAFIYVKIS